MKDRPAARHYLSTVALVGAATGAAFLARWTFLSDDLVMFYFVVIIVAASWGRGPSLVAAALSVATYDFLFVPPYHTFAVVHARHILTFGVMFAVGLLISGLN